MINRRKLLASIGSASFAWPGAARSQVARKVARIGVVAVGGTSDEMKGPLPRNRNVRTFLRGMSEQGYAFGRDFITEPRGIESLAHLGANFTGMSLQGRAYRQTPRTS
jgi:putative ABC transport system substrate-binding protein